MKMAFGGVAGVAVTSAVIAFDTGIASAQCNPGCAGGQQCCTTNSPANAPFCAASTSTCCGDSACGIGTQCCSTAAPNFCAPLGFLCCGANACPPGFQCCTTGAVPHCAPLGFICCGDTACAPGQVCSGYPAPSVCH
jgi:hypothetical protein